MRKEVTRTLKTYGSVAIGWAVLATAVPLGAAEKFFLSEDVASGATRLVECQMVGEGTFKFQANDQEGKPVVHPITLAGEFRYSERRLPGTGRGEAAYRSLRNYQEAKSTVRVGGQESFPTLRQERRQLVVAVESGTVFPYSPQGQLSPSELELLPSLGDSLLLAALLPGRAVEVGESWTPDSWIGPALAGAEVALNSNLTCRLDSVRDGVAAIHLEGTIEGAAKGATSETTLKGTLEYDVVASAVTSAELTQVERRSIGPLMPGVDLTLTADVRLADAPREFAISDSVAGEIPQSPPAELLQLEHVTTFGVTLRCDRKWLPFHQTDRMLVLRLLDRGGLVAQCNLAPAPVVTPGERTSDREFQEDIVRTLGKQLTKIVSAEEIPSGGLALYRVTAIGKVGDSDRLWRYYLITSPDGRQAACVFTAEPSTLPRLGEQDLELVKSVTFVSPQVPDRVNGR